MLKLDDKQRFRPAAAVAVALPTDPRAAQAARRFTRQVLAQEGQLVHSDVAQLLVSEIVTNAVRHAPGSIRLELAFGCHGLRCEVTDTSPVCPTIAVSHAEDEHGRGLHLLDQLASDWGYRPVAGGKVVWFDLAL